MHGSDSPAQRAVKLRQAMGFGGHGNSGRFAAFLGVLPQRWSNVEHGRPFSRDLANVIVAACPGMTRDWLETGDTSGLSQTWLARLGLLGEAPRPPDGGRRENQGR